MNHLRAILMGASLLSLTLLSTPVQAQESEDPRTTSISTDPVGLVFGGIWAEYEKKIGEQFTWGTSLSYNDFTANYSIDADVKGRLYLGGTAFKGFHVTSSVGLVRTADDYYICQRDTPAECKEEVRTFTGLTTGVELGYNWYVGKAHKFTISPRFGAKRHLGRDETEQRIFPTGAVSIGYVF